MVAFRNFFFVLFFLVHFVFVPELRERLKEVGETLSRKGRGMLWEMTNFKIRRSEAKERRRWEMRPIFGARQPLRLRPVNPSSWIISSTECEWIRLSSSRRSLWWTRTSAWWIVCYILSSFLFFCLTDWAVLGRGRQEEEGGRVAEIIHQSPRVSLFHLHTYSSRATTRTRHFFPVTPSLR